MRSRRICRELEEIIKDLRECMSLDDDDAGVKPVRPSGSRWFTYKLNAMKCLLSKLGAYTSHLATLSEDSSIKTIDHAQLKGYYMKYLLGCALFVVLWTPCSIFSKSISLVRLTVF
jgi:hypothetical protein